MKVKLASQLLSNSVADALLFCKDNLKLKDFEGCEATINFIRLFNDAFDILNSRHLMSYGFKGAVCIQNFENIYSFIKLFFNYVNNLRLETGQLLLKSQRCTGFLVVLLIKAIISVYSDIKINYLSRTQNETLSLRTWYNKLTLFRGH